MVTKRFAAGLTIITIACFIPQGWKQLLLLSVGFFLVFYNTDDRPPAPEPTPELVDALGKQLYIHWDGVNEAARNAYRKKIRAAFKAAKEKNQ